MVSLGGIDTEEEEEEEAREWPSQVLFMLTEGGLCSSSRLVVLL